MSGFITLYRDAFAHPLLKDAERFRAWFWLVANAAWPEGEISGSWDSFARAFGWNLLSAKRYLRSLERAKMVKLNAGDRYAAVCIMDRSTFEIDHFEGNGTGRPPEETGYAPPKNPVFGYERQTVSSHIRNAVLERDGSQCAYCGAVQGPFELDHIIPVAGGGGNDPDNLTVACKPCNRSKGALTLDQWRAGR